MIVDLRRGLVLRTCLRLRSTGCRDMPIAALREVQDRKRAGGTRPLRELLPSSRQFVLRFRLKITAVMPFMQLA